MPIDSQLRELSELADLVYVVRLPEQTHQLAGTNTTDRVWGTGVSAIAGGTARSIGMMITDGRG